MQQLTTLILLLFFSAGVQSQVVQTSANQSTAEASVLQEIRAMEQKLAQINKSGDVTSWDKIHAPGYVNTLGRVPRTRSKDEILVTLRNPANRGVIESLSYNVEKVQTFGNTAIATGKGIRRSTDAQGRRTDIETLFTHTWVRGADGWQLAAAHYSPLPFTKEEVEPEIQSWLSQLQQSQLSGDRMQAIAFVDSTYASSFKSLNPLGILTPKDSILARFRRQLSSPTTLQPFYETIRREDMQMDIYGDAAVVTLKAIGRTPTQASASIDPITSRQLYVFVRENGQWKPASTAYAPIRDSAKDKEQILALEEKRIKALNNKDQAAMAAYRQHHIAEDFYAVGTDGHVDLNSTSSPLATSNAASAERELIALTVEEPMLRHLGDAVSYTYKAIRKTKDAKGKMETNTYRVTRLYARRSSVWKLVSQHIVEIPTGKTAKR